MGQIVLGRANDVASVEAVRDATRAERLISNVFDVEAGRALLLDVRHFAIGRYLTIAAGDTTTTQLGEPEESNQAHFR
jgi:hypothetical protein